MKLRNKKTGKIHEITEVVSLHDMDKKFVIYSQTEGHNHAYKNLAELNAEWEDYKEPKEYWYYDTTKNGVDKITHLEDKEKDQAIGNYFETEEEAQKAVEKLKAWKRLKDTYYVSFDLDFVKNTINFTYRIDGTLHSAVNEERIVFEDMKTIFGGEE